MTLAGDTLTDAKDKVIEAVDRLADELEKVSLQIHTNPELAFKEERAAAWLTELLEKHGARVERGVGGLPTAFRATIPGNGPGPTVAILAEYDALPGIGHAWLPTIHPYIRICPDGVPGHSRELAEWAKSPLAHTGMVAAAKTLALTALDLLAHPGELVKAKEEFARG